MDDIEYVIEENVQLDLNSNYTFDHGKGDALLLSSLKFDKLDEQDLQFIIIVKTGHHYTVQIPSFSIMENDIQIDNNQYIINLEQYMNTNKYGFYYSYAQYHNSVMIIESCNTIENISLTCKFIKHKSKISNMNYCNGFYQKIKYIIEPYVSEVNYNIFSSFRYVYGCYFNVKSDINKLELKFQNQIIDFDNCIQLNKNTRFISFLNQNNSKPLLINVHDIKIVVNNKTYNVWIQRHDYKDIVDIYFLTEGIVLIKDLLLDVKIQPKDIHYYRELFMKIKPKVYTQIYEVLPSNNECFIMKVKIEEGQNYWKCDNCVCICDFENMLTWLDIQQKCPYCQKQIDVKNLKEYVNKGV